MRAFEYASPTTKEQAVRLLGDSWGETEVLAGGTDLLALMKDDVVTPKRLVNIKDIREFAGLHMSPKGGLRIGALVTIQQLLDHREVHRLYAGVTDAASGITSPQIRSMGTVGGDLCQRPRCWYYRAGYGLLAKDETGEPLVPRGENRYHAILGGGTAYFVSPSSLAPALIALQARLRVFGPKGVREVAADKFFLTPNSNAEREFDIMPNEILGEIVLPSPAGVRSATYEVRQKEALDWPLATASVVLKMSAGKVSAARVVLGAVAPIPWRSPEAEQSLVGNSITEKTALAAGHAAVEKAKALSQNGYKIQLALVAVKRAVLQAAQGGAK
jgi:xanthine dehydrogenase YagS FAD-binding subunit